MAQASLPVHGLAGTESLGLNSRAEACNTNYWLLVFGQPQGYSQRAFSRWLTVLFWFLWVPQKPEKYDACHNDNSHSR